MTSHLALCMKSIRQLVAPGEAGDKVADEHTDAEAVDPGNEESKRRKDRQCLIAGDVLDREKNVCGQYGAHDEVHDAVHYATKAARALEYHERLLRIAIYWPVQPKSG